MAIDFPGEGSLEARPRSTVASKVSRNPVLSQDNRAFIALEIRYTRVELATAVCDALAFGHRRLARIPLEHLSELVVRLGDVESVVASLERAE